MTALLTILRQSVMQPGERKSVWEFIQALQKSTVQSRDRMTPHLWATRQVEMVCDMGMGLGPPSRVAYLQTQNDKHKDKVSLK